MNYIDDLEKEITTIYLLDKISKYDQLMIFALYHSFYSYISYSLDNDSFANECHNILKEVLSKYCSSVRQSEKLDYKKFMVQYLSILKDTLLDDYAYCFLREIDSIIQELTWVDKINTKELSFDTKTKLVMIINNIINNTNYHFENIVNDEKLNDIKEEYRSTIIDCSINIDVENYFLDYFISFLKILTKKFIKRKVNSNEIDFGNTKDKELNDIYNYFNDNEKVVLKLILLHIICDISDEEFGQDLLLSELSEELDMSKTKIKILVWKFVLKWNKFMNKQSICNNKYKILR